MKSINLEILISDASPQTLIGGMRLIRSDGTCLGKVGCIQLDRGPLLSTALEYFSGLGVNVSIPDYVKPSTPVKSNPKPVKPEKSRVKLVFKKKS